MAKNTTLCYLEQDGNYLMLHRTKKVNDENRDKWIGVGGKFEDGESPEECMLREVLEETGLTVTSWQFRGIVTFVSDRWPCEYMHLFTCTGWTGTLHQCNEGDLQWISKDEVEKLNIWEGDKLIFNLLNTRKEFFSLKLTYRGEELVESRWW